MVGSQGQKASTVPEQCLSCTAQGWGRMLVLPYVEGSSPEAAPPRTLASSSQ